MASVRESGVVLSSLHSCVLLAADDCTANLGSLGELGLSFIGPCLLRSSVVTTAPYQLSILGHSRTSSKRRQNALAE